MRYVVPSFAVVSFVVAALVASAVFFNSWYTAPPAFQSCLQQGETVLNENPKFQACLKSQAAALLEHDYPEFKDISKAFLTLLSATLVLSITFSEKVVGLNDAPTTSVVALFASWGLLFVAIAACGAGLAYISHAAWTAKYDMRLNFLLSEVRAVSMLMLSLAGFVSGLAALVIAGVVSVAHRRTTSSAIA